MVFSHETAGQVGPRDGGPRASCQAPYQGSEAGLRTSSVARGEELSCFRPRDGTAIAIHVARYDVFGILGSLSRPQYAKVGVEVATPLT